MVAVASISKQACWPSSFATSPHFGGQRIKPLGRLAAKEKELDGSLISCSSSLDDVECRTATVVTLTWSRLIRLHLLGMIGSCSLSRASIDHWAVVSAFKELLLTFTLAHSRYIPLALAYIPQFPLSCFHSPPLNLSSGGNCSNSFNKEPGYSSFATSPHSEGQWFKPPGIPAARKVVGWLAKFLR